MLIYFAASVATAAKDPALRASTMTGRIGRHAKLLLVRSEIQHINESDLRERVRGEPVS